MKKLSFKAACTCLIREALILFLFFSGTYAFAQQTLSGKITDASDKKPVPFAVIIIDKTNKGTTADLDGNFTLSLPPEAQNITVQIIGYLTKTIAISTLSEQKKHVIELTPSGIKLSEIVVKPRENPAIPLIKKVLENKPKFDIANLPYYICKTYSKTYFTLSNKNGAEDFYNIDTAKFNKTKKLVEKNYLFLIESVTEKKYKYKNNLQEKILASKVSGFKEGPFGAFASQLQSFTFYGDKIELLGISYVSPLTGGTFGRYNFEITDTVLSNTDTTILVKFHPKKNAAFKGMKGMLYINKNQYVLANVLAEPAEIPKDGTGIRIQQLYQREDSAHWFPRQLNTELLFPGPKPSTSDSGNTTIMVKAVSRQYISDVKLDTTFKMRHKSVALYNDKDYADKENDFWNKERKDSLSQKDVRTYRLIDSIGKKENFDKKLKFFEVLNTGKLQVGYMNFNIARFMRVNDYEGFRLGAGVGTSNKLSRWFGVDGYGGYGLKDKAWKYGGSLRLNFDYRQSTYLLAEAAREVTESAGTEFMTGGTALISQEKLRDYLISRMDKVGFGRLSFNTPIFNFIKASAFVDVRQINSPFGYISVPDSYPWQVRQTFNINTAGLQLKIWPREKFVESFGRLVSMGSKWPVLFVNVTKGLTSKISDYKGDFDFAKIDLRIDQQINFKVKGFVSYEIQAGKVFGDVPYSLQYNSKGSRSSKYPIGVEKTMETIYLNEFTSTQYAALFFAINSGQLVKYNDKMNPELELVHNYMIGTLDNRQRITNVQMRDLSKGYSEVGLRIKNILHQGFTGFGIGVFYRYGNYATGDLKSDIVVKLAYSISL